MSLNTLKNSRVWLKRKQERASKYSRSDQGGEYTSGAFIRYCKNNGIQQQFTVPHTPQQNGVAERKIEPWLNVLAV
jgi:transposase InsO family protein